MRNEQMWLKMSDFNSIMTLLKDRKVDVSPDTEDDAKISKILERAHEITTDPRGEIDYDSVMAVLDEMEREEQEELLATLDKPIFNFLSKELIEYGFEGESSGGELSTVFVVRGKSCCIWVYSNVPSMEYECHIEKEERRGCFGAYETQELNHKLYKRSSDVKRYIRKYCM